MSLNPFENNILFEKVVKIDLNVFKLKEAEKF